MCWTSSLKAFDYGISSPSVVAACSLLSYLSFSWITFWVSFNWVIFWVSLNHLGVSSYLDAICHNWRIGDTCINLPSMAMSIAIHICCVPTAKLSNKSSQNACEFWQLKNSIFPWKHSIASSLTCDKGHPLDIWTSRNGQKNLEQCTMVPPAVHPIVHSIVHSTPPVHIPVQWLEIPIYIMFNEQLNIKQYSSSYNTWNHVCRFQFRWRNQWLK